MQKVVTIRAPEQLMASVVPRRPPRRPRSWYSLAKRKNPLSVAMPMRSVIIWMVTRSVARTPKSASESECA